jgi:F-type H+-transporting ATPase subunit b
VSITGTLIAQLLVFVILVAFTMKFVWPPIATALDERSNRVAEGLASADKARAELAHANARVEEELAQARVDIATRIGDADRRAQVIIEDAKVKASKEAAQILATAQAEAQQQAANVREALRVEVAALAVKGAEQILRREVDAKAHAQLLDHLKTEF